MEGIGIYFSGEAMTDQESLREWARDMFFNRAHEVVSTEKYAYLRKLPAYRVNEIRERIIEVMAEAHAKGEKKGRRELNYRKDMLINFLVSEHKIGECFCEGERTVICEWCQAESCLKAFTKLKESI